MLRRLSLTLPLLLLMACAQNRTIGDRVDDTAAGLNLKSQLLFNRSVDTSDIDVAIFEGRMLLTGTVRSEEDRAEIEDKAAELRAVREVINELKIDEKTTVGQGTRDALIDQKLKTAIIADTGVAAGNYRVQVSKGTVYLLGLAQGPKELNRVVGQAQAIDGVNEVVSHVIYVRDPRRTGS